VKGVIKYSGNAAHPVLPVVGVPLASLCRSKTPELSDLSQDTNDMAI
jgi:hypothetical protein